MRKTKRLAIASAITLILFSGASPLVGGQPGAGGSAGNAAPVVETFLHDGVTTAVDVEVGYVGNLTGTISDKNKAVDLAKVTLNVDIDDGSGPATTSIVGTVPATLPATKPGSPDADGFYFWSADGPTKILSFEFAYTYSEIASFSWTVTAEDDDTATHTSTISIVVRAFEFHVDDTTFYLFDGAGADGATVWGDWFGLPGEEVNGTNLLRVRNGPAATQSVAFSINSDEFTGSDGVEVIDLTAVGFQFLYAIVAPGEPAPAQSAFTPATMTAASTTVDFTAAGQIMYVYYSLTLPDPLADQVYSASATATAM